MSDDLKVKHVHFDKVSRESLFTGTQLLRRDAGSDGSTSRYYLGVRLQNTCKQTNEKYSIEARPSAFPVLRH
jgi:hypothetical protein